jgi:hypothetical protein
VFSLAGCDFIEDLYHPGHDDEDESPDVYVAGFESNGSKEVAKVWKNGVATSLTNGINNARVKSLFVVE